MDKPSIKIEVFSDVVCPWCYIGKRRLEKAMTMLKDTFNFSIEYQPFELNPTMPKSGRNQREYLTSKFGSNTQYEKIIANTTKIAAEEGLRFDFSRQNVSPNTRDAHRVIWLAKKEGKQNEVKEAFLKAYFEDGVDLSQSENLINIAQAAGLRREHVTNLLVSNQGADEVLAQERLNLERGVTGVPFYIINNKYGISGAQAPATFVEAFQEIGKELKLTADTCGIDSQEC